MGWFFFGNDTSKPKTRRSSKKSQEADQASWFQRVLSKRALLLAVGAVVLVTLIVTSWVISKKHLVQYTSHRDVVPFAVEDVALANAPMWMSYAIQLELQEAVATQLPVNPLDEQGMSRLLRTLSLNPWVQQVERIERHGGMIRHNGRRHLQSVIVLHASYRKPMAVVQESRDSDRYHWVDRFGVRLPVVCRGMKEVELCGLPLIVNVHSAPSLQGEVWPGEDLKAGLALVNQSGMSAYLKQIQAIDVGAKDQKGRIHLFLPTDKPSLVKWKRDGGSDSQTRHMMRQALRSKGRSGIIWGLAPGAEEAIDPLAPVKVKRLESVQRQKGTIDARGRVVDISGATALVLNPTFADRR
jgi:hypothetical protein